MTLAPLNNTILPPATSASCSATVGIHLIPDGQRAQFFGVASGTSGNRANEHPVQLVVGIPPRGILIAIERSREILLPHLPLFNPDFFCVQGHHLAFGIGEEKEDQLPGKLPKRAGSRPESWARGWWSSRPSKVGSSASMAVVREELVLPLVSERRSRTRGQRPRRYLCT